MFGKLGNLITCCFVFGKSSLFVILVIGMWKNKSSLILLRDLITFSKTKTKLSLSSFDAEVILGATNI